MTIDEFMNKFWPEPRFKVKSSEHKEWLSNFVPKEVLKELNELILEYTDRPDDETDKKLMEFIYKEELWDKAFPVIENRSREALRILLKYFEDKDEFTLADLGSGSGKIAVGLSLYLKNLKKVFAFERAKEGINVMARIIEGLTKKDKDKINQKIIPVSGDYRCAFYQREVFRSNPHGTDYTLGIHSGEDGNILIPAAKQITKGKMIFAYEQDFNLGEKFTPEEQIGIRGSVMNSEFGFYNLTSRIIDWHKDTEDKTIIFFECHKPE
ncbi:hypothetical protein J4459_01520 [Candidatus Woesearchaeota archaeon]|nr:hypothetical protein [Candidatus Woesearchaeota archaeon]